MELVEKFDIKQIEKNVQNDLKDKDISKLIQQDDTKNEIMFIEGPPTMNGIPHAGHLREEFSKIYGIDTMYYQETKSFLMQDGIHKDYLLSYSSKRIRYGKWKSDISSTEDIEN